MRKYIILREADETPIGDAEPVVMDQDKIELGAMALAKADSLDWGHIPSDMKAAYRKRSQLCQAAASALADTPAPHAEVREALERIIAVDQHERSVTIECDPAGNTMAVETVDGPCAVIARAVLALPQSTERGEVG